MSNDALKRCPFCNGEARLYPAQRSDENETEVIGPAMVLCWDCDASWQGDFDHEAIDGWNRRAAPTAAELADAVDAIFQIRGPETLAEHRLCRLADLHRGIAPQPEPMNEVDMDDFP